MQLGKFIEGLSILRPHYEDNDGYHLGADHDIIYIYATTTPLTDEEAAKMFELGFFQPDVPDDEEGNQTYNAEEGWAAYV